MKGIILVITYVIALKLLVKAKQLEYESLIYWELLEQNDILNDKRQVLKTNEQLILINEKLMNIKESIIRRSNNFSVKGK